MKPAYVQRNLMNESNPYFQMGQPKNFTRYHKPGISQGYGNVPGQFSQENSKAQASGGYNGYEIHPGFGEMMPQTKDFELYSNSQETHETQQSFNKYGGEMGQHQFDMYNGGGSQSGDAGVSPINQTEFSPVAGFNQNYSAAGTASSSIKQTQLGQAFDCNDYGSQSSNASGSPISFSPITMYNNDFGFQSGDAEPTPSPINQMQLSSVVGTSNGSKQVERPSQSRRNQSLSPVPGTSPNPANPRYMFHNPPYSPSAGYPRQNRYDPAGLPISPARRALEYLPQSVSTPPSTPPTSLAPPTPPPQAERFTCRKPNCTRSFGRKDDRHRHENTASVHNNQQHHFCSVAHCSRGNIYGSSFAGYTRIDKLKEHMWKRHSDLGYTKRG